MHPSFPWMSVCIYRTSVNALTSLALFTLKAASWKHFFKDIFLKDPWLLYAMDPFWLSSCVLIALDLLLHLFVCVTIHISVRLRSGNSAYAPEGCAFWSISRIYQHYRWSLSLYINVQDLPLPPNNPTSSTQIIPPPPQSPWCTSSLPHHTTPQPKLGGNIIRDSRLWAWWVRAVKETAWCLRGPWDPTALLSKVGGKISLCCFGMAVVSVSLFGLICVLMYTCVGGCVWTPECLANSFPGLPSVTVVASI